MANSKEKEYSDYREERRKEIDRYERAKPYTSDECWRTLSFSYEEKEGFRTDAEEMSEGPVRVPEVPQVFHLHIELSVPLYSPYDELATYFGGEDEFMGFLRLAKAEKGVSRDFLVPSDMNLHALHYAIQQAFGWRNGHLHRFCLSEENYDRLTAGRLGGFLDLCGILFRGNSEDNHDIYWDDDYLPSLNFRNWLKKKYRRPFCNYSVTDTRFGSQDFLCGFNAVFPDASRDSWRRLVEADLADDLMEGLRLKDLLSKDNTWRSWDNGQLRKWKEEVLREAALKDYEYEESVIRKCNKGRPKYLGTADFEEALDMVRQDIDELNEWRESACYITDRIWRDHMEKDNAGNEDIRKQTGMDACDALAGNMRMIRSYRRKLRPIFEEYVILPRPFTDEILYQYDYGDDWCLKVSLVQCFSMEDPGASAECRTVFETGKSVCIAADGVNLIDDVGGIRGFYDFLKAVYGKDKKEKESMLQWASGSGWKGTVKKPKMVL